MHPPCRIIPTYALRELRRRPTAFLGGFLCCFAGLLIALNMLFMQYGSYLAEIDRTAVNGHLQLPRLSLEEISSIAELPYVRSAEAHWTGESYTAHILLNDGDPARLRDNCDRILRDTGLINSSLCVGNTYYEMYGPMPNWINRDYSAAATSVFWLQVSPLMLILGMFTAFSIGSAVGIKLVQDGDDYAAMRSFGMSPGKITRLLLLQYILLFFVAAVFAVPAAALIFRAFCIFLARHFTADYWQMRFAIPIPETLGFILIQMGISAAAIVLTTRHHLRKTDHRGDGIGDSTPSLTGPSLLREGLGRYPILYLLRNGRTALAAVLRQAALLCLPLFFVLLAIFAHGIRAQAEVTDCTFSLHMGQLPLCAERYAEIAQLPEVEHLEPLHPYDDGSYGGVRIWCAATDADALRPVLETMATADGLLFFDHFLNDRLVILQSNINTVFYLLEAALLYLAALAVLAAEGYASLRRRNGEFAILLAMGIDSRRLSLFCRPTLIIASLSLCISLAASAIFILLFTEGSPLLRPMFVVPLMAGLGGLHLGIHAWICRRFIRGIAGQNPAALLKEDF